MTRTTQRQRVVCAVCGKTQPAGECAPLGTLRQGIAGALAEDHPGLPADAPVCRDDVARYRRSFLERLMGRERGELSALDRQVVDAMASEQTLAQDIAAAADRELTLGQRVADKVADFGGSWTFIISFGVVLVVWMLLNTLALRGHAFDPYPYILLNLVLSCLAAIQAPVIMMSQNRQEVRDRRRAENDYQVNLKAELEIRHLHEKIDFLLQQQWERLLEIQELQIEMMEEVTRAGRRA